MKTKQPKQEEASMGHYRISRDGKSVYVYLRHTNRYWLVFAVFGYNNLYCGYTASCTGADNHIYPPDAREQAIRFLNR